MWLKQKAMHLLEHNGRLLSLIAFKYNGCRSPSSLKGENWKHRHYMSIMNKCCRIHLSWKMMHRKLVAWFTILKKSLSIFHVLQGLYCSEALSFMFAHLYCWPFSGLNNYVWGVFWFIIRRNNIFEREKPA